MYLANTEYKISLERFVEHYKAGTIKEITLEEIPQEAMELFERKSQRFILPETYKERNFENSFIINHFNYNNYKTHVVIQEKEYITSKTVEKTIYLYESTNENIKIGHGEIRFDYQSKEKFFMNKPFVGYNNTEEDFRRQGYGINRLKVMNALSYMFFNLPLNSDNTIIFQAKNVWKKLEKNNEVQPYSYNNYYGNKRITINRFVFVV